MNMLLMLSLLMVAASVAVSNLAGGSSILKHSTDQVKLEEKKVVARGTVFPHAHADVVPTFTATAVDFLHAATGESLLERDLHSAPSSSPSTASTSRRRLAAVDEVVLRFTYNGDTIERRVPAGASVLGEGLKVKVHSADGVVEKDGAAFHLPSFRSRDTAVTYDHDKLHAVLTVGKTLLQLDKASGSDEWVVQDLSVLAAGVAGTGATTADAIDIDAPTNPITVSGPYDVADTARHLRSAAAVQQLATDKEQLDWSTYHVHERRRLARGSRRLEDLAEQWTDCYANDETRRRFSMGMILASNMYQLAGNTDAAAMAYLQQLVIDANIIYENQLNIILTIGDVKLYATYTGESFDNGPGCPNTINEQLDALSFWQNRDSVQGVWAVIDKCAATGTIGLAYIGVLCRTFYSSTQGQVNTQVNYHTQATWLTFAHETGHNFGAHHSFEEGQGTTGGIMDYGDGLLDGIYQFNSQYRESEVCAEVSYDISNGCPAFSTYAPTCGDGVLDGSEQCECYDMSASCKDCVGCVLAAGAECSQEARVPASPGAVNGQSSVECCGSDGTFNTRGDLCGGGVTAGYCDTGSCMVTPCASYVWATSGYNMNGFCDLDPNNECMEYCMLNDVCQDVTGWTLGGVPVSQLNGGTCTTSSDQAGSCVEGQCVYVPESIPSAVPTHAPTESEVETSEPTSLPTAVPFADTAVSKTPTPQPSFEVEVNDDNEGMAVPTAQPTSQPTNEAGSTVNPTQVPTVSTTPPPTVNPTQVPTPVPTHEPSSLPTSVPTPVPIVVVVVTVKQQVTGTDMTKDTFSSDDDLVFRKAVAETITSVNVTEDDVIITDITDVLAPVRRLIVHRRRLQTVVGVDIDYTVTTAMLASEDVEDLETAVSADLEDTATFEGELDNASTEVGVPNEFGGATFEEPEVSAQVVETDDGGSDDDDDNNGSLHTHVMKKLSEGDTVICASVGGVVLLLLIYVYCLVSKRRRKREAGGSVQYVDGVDNPMTEPNVEMSDNPMVTRNARRQQPTNKSTPHPADTKTAIKAKKKNTKKGAWKDELHDSLDSAPRDPQRRPTLTFMSAPSSAPPAMAPPTPPQRQKHGAVKHDKYNEYNIS